MKAVVYRQKGPAAQVLRVEELPRPVPQAGEVLVRIEYSGINPSDTKGRGGIAGPTMEHEYVVPHSDGAGSIVALGAGVGRQWLNRRVWVFMAGWQRQHGTAAEFVALPLDRVVPLPKSVDSEVGASIGIPLMTAQYAIASSGKSLQGKTVLVTGGAGAVGIYAIQLAKAAGARVAATVSSDTKAALALEAGAALTVNYKEQWLEPLRAFSGGRGFDLIIEVNAAENARHYGELLAFGGTAVVYGSMAAEIPTPYRGMMMRFGAMRFFVVYLLPPDQLRRSVRAMQRLLAGETLRHPPVEVFAPEQAAAAHEFVEAGRGKALIGFGPID